jgi:hypothetical protein
MSHPLSPIPSLTPLLTGRHPPPKKSHNATNPPLQPPQYYGDADYVCNWLGGEVIATRIEAANYTLAGFANISTSDGQVHGQVRQAGHFAFARFYESGHEVPFYKPLAALEMFERVVNGRDIETGTIDLSQSPGYVTVGDEKSTFREGNKTVQQSEVGADDDVVYDVETALPVYENGTSADTGPGAGGQEENLRKRGLSDDASKKQRRRPYRFRPGKRNLYSRMNEGVVPGLRLREMYGL